MVKLPISLAERARGALLGHACGSAAGRASASSGAEVEMALILGEWVADGGSDARALLDRWLGWARQGGQGLDAWTREALELYGERHRPPTRMEAAGRAGSGAVARALPVALATLSSPRNLLSATLHTAELTHPAPEAAWPAVAVNVAAHCLLLGQRDFIPEVIAALEMQVDVPLEILEAVRRVPFERREELVTGGQPTGSALHTMEVALWCAHHEHSLERTLSWLADVDGGAGVSAAVAGGLLGARDGDGAIPAPWLAALSQRERILALAERLAGATSASSRA
jgi:ADP-ribosyl-[dinitrogen reductase] hydrolase